jgi:hypothetical protein
MQITVFKESRAVLNIHIFLKLQNIHITHVKMICGLQTFARESGRAIRRVPASTRGFAFSAAAATSVR